MNYLLEAAQILGIFYTPSRILAVGYGDGKTAPEYIVGNPPFTTPCPVCTKCLGFMTIMNTDGSLEICRHCRGSGEEPSTR